MVRQPTKAVTIHDVARRAQVSVATVSRVLNGIGTVDPALAQRVRAAVTETGYVPNPTGRALRRQKSDVWAAIVPDLQNSFFTAAVASVEEVAIENGFSVMLCNSDERLDRERRYVRAALTQKMAGVIMAVTSETDSDLTELQAAGVPLVLIDRRVQHFEGDMVLVDNELAGRLAAQHLLATGRTRIACIAGPRDVSTTEDRLIGFRAALDEAGVGLPDALVRRANLRSEGGEIAVRSLLASGQRPDAVFVTNGPVTSGAFRGIRQVGRTMPDDIALVGTDDDKWTRMVDPDVSVIQQPVDRIGRLAAELLAFRARDGAGAGETIVLPPTLLVRGSSRP